MMAEAPTESSEESVSLYDFVANSTTADNSLVEVNEFFRILYKI